MGITQKRKVMSKEITVQIRVVEYTGDDRYYMLDNSMLIPKKFCTVVSPSTDSEEKVEHKHANWREHLNSIPSPSPSHSPKLIARAGEHVKIVGAETVDNIIFNNSEFSFNKPYELRYDLTDSSGFGVVKDDSGYLNGIRRWAIQKDGIVFERCEPIPERKIIGTYEGNEIYECTKAWFVNLEKLRIEQMTDIIEDFDMLGFEDSTMSKSYLSPKEANERLKSEVEKVAKERKLSISECIEATQNSTPLAFAIELVEKEKGVKYLEE